jgi:hypothetical protein
MNKFFENLPGRIKLALHVIELALCMYVATGVMLLFTPYGEYVKPYLEIVAIGFLLIYPPVHALVEACFGEKKPDAPQSLTDLVGEQIRAAIVRLFNRGGTNDKV